MCCDNPIDLGCFNSCENILTNVSLVGTWTYTIVYNFNNSEVTQTFTTTGNNANKLEIPYNLFNESTSTTFALYDNEGAYINCFKFNMVSSTFIVNTDDSLNTVSSYQFDGCATSKLTGKFIIEFSNYDALQNGTTFNFTPDIDIIPSGSTTATLTAISTGITVSGTTITIVDKTLLPLDFKIYIGALIVNPACLQQMTIGGEVTAYSNIIEGFKIGVQVPCTQYTFIP
jgi:hypothetical protein